MPAATSWEGLISMKASDIRTKASRAQAVAMKPPTTCWKNVGSRLPSRSRLVYIRANVETIEMSPASGVPPSWMTIAHPSIAQPNTATRNEWGCGDSTIFSTSAVACPTVS